MLAPPLQSPYTAPAGLKSDKLDAGILAPASDSFKDRTQRSKPRTSYLQTESVTGLSCYSPRKKEFTVRSFNRSTVDKD